MNLYLNQPLCVTFVEPLVSYPRIDTRQLHFVEEQIQDAIQDTTFALYTDTSQEHVHCVIHIIPILICYSNAKDFISEDIACSVLRATVRQGLLSHNNVLSACAQYGTCVIQ